MKTVTNQIKQAKYTERDGIRYRIPTAIPNYSDVNGKLWAEVYLPGHSVEVQEERQRLYDQLEAEFRHKNDIYEWGGPDLYARQFFDDTIWEIRDKLYDMDHCGVTHFQTRVVFGYINSKQPMFGLQYLKEHKFEMADETVHTFDVWVNSGYLTFEAKRGHSADETVLHSGINHIDEDGEFISLEEEDEY